MAISYSKKLIPFLVKLNAPSIYRPFQDVITMSPKTTFMGQANANACFNGNLWMDQHHRERLFQHKMCQKQHVGTCKLYTNITKSILNAKGGEKK